MTTQKNNQIAEVYAHYIKMAYNWKKDQTAKEINKDIFEVVRFTDGELVGVKKMGRLETEIWIGEGRDAGRTFEEAQEICNDINQNKQANFIYTNTRYLDAKIEKLDNYIKFLRNEDRAISGGDIFYFDIIGREQNPYNPLRIITYNLHSWVIDENKNLKPLNLQDAQIYKAVLLRLRGEQVKRCKTYIKRFGTKKILARTYWADR